MCQVITPTNPNYITSAITGLNSLNKCYNMWPSFNFTPGPTNNTLCINGSCVPPAQALQFLFGQSNLSLACNPANGQCFFGNNSQQAQLICNDNGYGVPCNNTNSAN